MSAGYLLLTNVTALAIAEVITKLLGLATVALYSRILGPAGLGEISIAATAANYLLLACTWGYTYFGLEEIGRPAAPVNHIVSSVQSLRGTSAALGIALFTLILSFLPLSMHFKVTLFLYALTVLTTCAALDWAFQGMNQLRPVAWSRVIGAVSFAAIIFWMIPRIRSVSVNIWVVPSALVISQCAAAAYLWFRYRRRGYRVSFVFQFPEWLAIYRTYWLIGLSTFLWNCLLNLDILLLGYLTTTNETGLYSAAYRIINHLQVFALIFNAAAYPLMIGFARDRWENLIKFATYATRLAVTVYGPACIIGIFLAGPIFKLIFGSQFLQAIDCFQILLPSTLFTALNQFYGFILLANQRRRTYTWILSVQVIASLMMNCFLIPHWGRTGAAVSTLLSEMGGTAILLMLLKGAALLKGRSILKPVPALLILSGGILLCRYFFLSAWMIAPLALLLYAIALIGTKGVTREDVRYLFAILRKTG